MNVATSLASRSAAPVPRINALDRKCSCGRRTATGGVCGLCRRSRTAGSAGPGRAAVLLPPTAISKPNDGSERAADQMAERALRDRPSTFTPSHARLAEPPSTLLAPAFGGSPAVRGRPLDDETRAFIEPRLGRDLGDVRVHAGVPKTTRSVGRPDVKGRADLLGMIDPVFLKNWLDAGEITPEQYSRQTAAKPTLFEEDAEVILKAMGVLRLAGKASFIPETDDPVERLRDVDSEAKAKLASVRERRRGVDNTTRWLDTVEAIKRVEDEIAGLRKQLSGTGGGASR